MLLNRPAARGKELEASPVPVSPFRRRRGEKIGLSARKTHALKRNRRSIGAAAFPSSRTRVIERVWSREIGKKCLHDIPHEYVFQSEIVPDHLPYALNEREIRAPALEQRIDKIFAGAWVDENSVLIGSKCNKLLYLNTITSKYVNVPLIKYELKPRRPLAENCGTHTITLNPSGDLVCSGSYDPQDMALYRLPSLDPVALLHGHSDWVFGSAWIDDNTLITGSRDRTVKVWKIDAGLARGESSSQTPSFCETTMTYTGIPHITCVESKNEHTNKIRDIRTNSTTKEFGSLAHDNTLKIWDSQRVVPILSKRLDHPVEAVCLAVSDIHNVYVVGSRDYISLLDPRTREFRSYESQDKGKGVRSLSFYQHMITVGGGGGLLSFFDIRKNAFMDIVDEDSGEVDKGLYVGDGVRFEASSNIYANDTENAVYTHAYDPTGTRLLVAGGPLIYGSSGFYCAVW
mmetsp:Transcript_10235/g.16770  ORF Transcript_10235/g.16770 Transcript_10235/m.16770 type:complete len:459 (+) Transcript_10235:133-1509(+)|eukprot:CAMPEP_0184656826 /NCGR_PEP_ID=MMETSP0308-20130426/16785_1 /TAXON_ID=38269 /ORGANISM="Gloeochaete witrockiana, Strain SAG 46.84" /LENGTH=458 /DNA_ID=CAMNT_0027094125 /DNA_START=112 /DNA_END=1485 /DNA_ORIENTATION=-